MPEPEAIDFEASWGHTIVLPKDFGEIVRGTESTLLRQLLDRESTLSDQVHGMFQTNEAKVSTWRNSPSFLEKTREVIPAHLRDACHVRDADGMRIVLTAKLLDLNDEWRDGRQAANGHARRGAIFVEQLH